MIPNKDKRFDDNEDVLFRCECKGDHFLEVVRDKDPNDPDLSIYFIDQPVSLWRTLKNYWIQKRYYFTDIILRDSDMEELVKVLNNYLEDKKKNKKIKEGL